MYVRHPMTLVIRTMSHENGKMTPVCVTRVTSTDRQSLKALVSFKNKKYTGVTHFNGSTLKGGGWVGRWCLVNFQCRGVLLIWLIEGIGPTALAVGAGEVVWTFLLSSIFSLLFLPLFGRRPDID